MTAARRLRRAALVLAALAVLAALGAWAAGRLPAGPPAVAPGAGAGSATRTAAEGAATEPDGAGRTASPGGGARRADRIQLVAVQMRWRLEDYATAERFAARVEGLMRQAAARLDPSLPALVVFPEDVGILTGLIGEGDALAGAATLEEAVERLARRHLTPVLWQRTRYGVSWPRAIFLARHEVMARTYFETFSAAARRHRVYLVAGSIPLPDYDLPADGSLPRSYRPRGTAVHNVSYVFGPDGRILGRQKKVHLLDLEGPAGLDLVPGRPEELTVIPTPLGRLGVAICLDAFKEDVLARLAEQGAEILVQPSANPAPWSPEQQADWLNGSWRAVAGADGAGRFAYAVNPMMVGQVLNLGFYGQSAIFAHPAALPRSGALLRDEASPARGAGRDGQGALGYEAIGPRPGFLTVAPDAEGEAVLVVTVPHPLARP